MSIGAVSLQRVSLNMRAMNLLNALRANQSGLFGAQNQISTGLKFQTPSQDPLGAATVLRLNRRLDQADAVSGNLQTANTFLSESESAAQSAIDLMNEGISIALQASDDSTSTDERASLATVASSLLDQLVTVANSKYLSNYLFSGRPGGGLPFVQGANTVAYDGASGSLQAILDTDLSSDSFSISGQQLFSAVSAPVGGKDLNPALTSDTRLADLRGAADRGITPGRMSVSNGIQSITVDLSGADTAGDIVTELNAAGAGVFSAALTSTGIQLQPIPSSGALTVSDLDGGRVAIDLGLATSTASTTIQAADLNPVVTNRTTLASLNGGAGIDLTGGIILRNGSASATISFAGDDTVEDVLNKINATQVGVRAEISPDRDGITLTNIWSGSELRVEENGGAAAGSLGIRTFQPATLLAQLNDGRGVSTVQGADFRITTASGATIDIDLDALNLSTATVSDVINLINTQAAGAVNASLKSTGNGIQITDQTSGGGTLTIEKLNLSPAIDGLGLNVTASGGVLAGEDVSPVTVSGPFSALIQLRNAMQTDDRQAIADAAARLRGALTVMQKAQGELAAKTAAMQTRSDRVASQVSATQILKSNVQDVDLTDAIVKFQQMQIALQASLQTGAQVMNLSLLNYLR